jgi:hypothetical protein
MDNIENGQLKPARDVLAEILKTMPNAKLTWDPYTQTNQPELARMVDFTVTVDNGNYSHTLVVEVVSQGHPRQLRDAINKLLRFRNKANRPDYLVVAAPFITAEGAALCHEDGIGYYDFAGNCRLTFGNYFIERIGSPNPFRKTQSPAAPYLYGPKSERVLRILFGEQDRTWKVVPLADEAHVSTGTVSIVRNLLLEREWARETDDGLKLTQPGKLLKDWAVVWGRRRQIPRTYFTLLTLADVEAKLADYAQRHARPFALTGTAGAWRRAPMTRYNRTQVYWDGDPAELANAADLKPADAGANVHIFEPRDEGVFLHLEKFDGVPVVSPLQLYLDLQRDPARGEEAADHLWTTVLFPDHAPAH